MSDDENEKSLTMEGFDINVGRFIEEVQKRRAIWDTHCEQYSNREKKAKCWAELVELFGEFGDCGDDDAAIATRKKETEFILQKKWKNIRTCFTRDLRLQKKRAKKRPAETRHHAYSYKYYTKLKFLTGVTKPRPHSRRYSSKNGDTDSDAEGSENTSIRDKRDSTSNADQIEVDLEPMEDGDDQLSSEEFLSNYKATQVKPPKKPKLKLKVEPEPEPETNFLEVDMNSMERRQLLEEHDDEDKLFLLSLLSTMKLVPPEKKMTTRIKIMTVLNEATQTTFRYGEASSNTYHN